MTLPSWLMILSIPTFLRFSTQVVRFSWTASSMRFGEAFSSEKVPGEPSISMAQVRWRNAKIAVKCTAIILISSSETSRIKAKHF